MEGADDELLAKVSDSIKSCRRRIGKLQNSLAGNLDEEQRTEIEAQLQMLKSVLSKQEDAFEGVRPRERTLPTTLLVIALVFLLIYFSAMLVMQAFLPANA